MGRQADEETGLRPRQRYWHHGCAGRLGDQEKRGAQKSPPLLVSKSPGLVSGVSVPRCGGSAAGGGGFGGANGGRPRLAERCPRAVDRCPGRWNSAPAPHGGTPARRSAAPGRLSDAPAGGNSAPAASSAAPAANGGGVFGQKSPVSGRQAAPRGEIEAVGAKIGFIAVGRWNAAHLTTSPGRALVGHLRRPSSIKTGRL